MDIDKFVQNVKFYCERRGVKPTNACRESGAGKSLINQLERQGSIPSVEKVQLLAQYLGVTTSELLGEVPNANAPSDLPGTLPLRDSAARLDPSDIKILEVREVEMVMAYRAANADDRMIVDAALRKYRKKETTSGAG